MSNKSNIKAFIDGLEKLTVEVDNVYYNGDVNYYILADENNNYIDTRIIDKVSGESSKTYTLEVPSITIGMNYELIDERHLRVPVEYRYVVRSEEFEQSFYYDGDDLGFTYSKENTTFKVWAPTASKVKLDICSKSYSSYEMEREDKGIWSITVQGDLESAEYVFLVNIGGRWTEATDPYAIASTPNHKKSVVVDLSKAEIDMNTSRLSELRSYTDMTIYEMHIRDFSMHESSNIKLKGKFLGAAEEGTKNTFGQETGLDHLIDLGISHVQLLPIYDFGSVDELKQTRFYNWGYDPVQYNTPEGSYATDVEDPYSRIRELKLLVSKLHAKGLRVVMDVVYNHMFDRWTSSFENLVPYYYFRIGQNGEISNGSFCSNDFDSTKSMARKFIVNSVENWMKIYSIDGFRFDLMGILDIETMNQVLEKVKSIDESGVVYGEGWNMPTLMDDSLKATMMNQEKMDGIAFFNDVFRDQIKGSTRTEEVKNRGMFTGGHRNIKNSMSLLLGSSVDLDGNTLFSDPYKSINYVECHDNHTLWDKMLGCLPKADEDELVKRQKLINSVVILSQGVPLLHAGQEFCRTKHGDHNSYMSPDSLNAIDWDKKKKYHSVYEYTKDAIKLRKENDEFRYETDHEIKQNVEGEFLSKALMRVSYGPSFELYINLSKKDQHIELKEKKVLKFNRYGLTEEVVSDGEHLIKGLELLVFKKL